MGQSREPGGKPVGHQEPNHRLTIERVPDPWHDLLTKRATELTVTKSALARMILRDWVIKERDR